MKRHRFLVYFETYLTPIMQFFRNISSTLQTWQNDRIWRLFVFGFHQKSFTTICELSWMPTTQSILSSRLRSVPPCRLRPPVLSDHICLAHWVVVIYRFYCSWVASYLQRSLSAQVNGGSRCHHWPLKTAIILLEYSHLPLISFLHCWL